MSDYTPTTDSMLDLTSDIYQTYVVGCRASKLRPQRHPDEDSDNRERFARWLAEVKAEAWEEGCRWGAVEFQTLEAKLEDEDKVQVTDADNPYRGANK